MDTRTIYTEKILTEALEELLKAKPLYKITVAEICRKAQVNRSTFYVHFKDIYDIYEAYENAFIKDMLNYALPENIPQNEHDYRTIIESSIGYIQKNQSTYKNLTSSNSPGSFVEHYIDGILTRYHMYSRFDLIYPDTVEQRFALIYCNIGTLAVITTWLEQYPNISNEKIADIIMNIYRRGIFSKKYEREH